MGEAKRRRAREAEQHAVLMACIAEQLRPPEEYAHMSVRDYWEMLEGEDPDDRAIREAHGFGYNEGWRDRALTCRYGCGATYHEISGGKMRTCSARPPEPENGPRFATGGMVAAVSPGSDEVPAILSRGYVIPAPSLTPGLIEQLNAREPEE